METLLGFAPFFVYVVIERLVGIMPGLVSAAIASALLLLRDITSRTRTVKILDIGTVILFGGLAAYARFAAVTWSIVAVRLRVDTGLLLIVLASIVLRRPFTLQYAREKVAREFWGSSEFVHINYVLTAAWAGAFRRDGRRGPGHVVCANSTSLGQRRRNGFGDLWSVPLYRLVSRAGTSEGSAKARMGTPSLSGSNPEEQNENSLVH